MRQFIDGSEHEWTQLRRRAERACICFPGQTLPPGADPTAARVGFEVNPRTGRALLFVDEGCAYAGPVASVNRWLQEGKLDFDSFDQLVGWVRGDLAAAFTGAVPSQQAVDPGRITDLQQVGEGSTGRASVLYLDKEDLIEALELRVRGQRLAVEVMAGMVSRQLARIQPRRPAVLFSVGPTGVGKTHAARSLPAALRQAAGADPGYGFLRLDMSEYQEAYRVSQLLGSPQGYVGHDEGSQLLDALMSNPRHVVLFDEIEKAHPAILRALMNAMDAGRLSSAARTEGGSREVDCSKALFVFTSNIDAEGILADLAAPEASDDPARCDEVCRRRLRAAGLAPEIVGRIGRFMVFWPLSTEARAEIAVLAVVEVAEEYGLVVCHVDPEIVVSILKRSDTASFGARVDRYAVDEMLGPVLAKAAADCVRGRVKLITRGDDVAVIDAESWA